MKRGFGHNQIALASLIAVAMIMTFWSGANSGSEQVVNPETLQELSLPVNNYGVFTRPNQSVEAAGNAFVFNGDALFRWDYYDVDGDRSRAIFPNTGNHPYLESNLRWSKRQSVNHISYHELGLLLNDSEYRADDNGLILERYHSMWDRGDVAHPFRARVGDFFGFQSPRSIQRQLKGLSIELQPRLRLQVNLSLLLFSGIDAQDYRNIDNDNDEYHGLSSLWQFANGANLALNYLSTHQSRDASLNPIDASQDLVGANLEWPFVVGRHQILVESEILQLSGNRQDGGRVDDGDAFYFRISDSPNEKLRYSLSTEQFGRDYDPRGGFVTPDRRTLEARSLWKFNNGLRLSGRAREDTDSRSTDTALTTRVLGLRLNGQIRSAINPTSISIDSFVQSQFDDNGLRDTDTNNVSVNLRRQTSLGMTHILEINARNTDNRINGDGSDEIGVSYALQKGFLIMGWQGAVEPGILIRETDGTGSGISNKGTTTGPTLRINARKGHRQFNFEYRQISEDRDSLLAEDLDRDELNFSYSQILGAGRFGVDGQFHISSPGNNPDTESMRIGVFYRLNFGGRRRDSSAEQAGTGVTIASKPPESLLFDFYPGLSIGDVQGKLDARNIGVGISQGANTIYEHTAFDRIDSRQRLVLYALGDRLSQSGWIIEFSDLFELKEIEQDYFEALQQLIRLLGTPQRSYDQGEFDQDLADALLRNEFQRVSEWQFSNGIVRFGIPPRLDRNVRMEILFSGAPLPTVVELWGINDVQ